MRISKTRLKRTLLTQSQQDAIIEAVDFISANSDSAEDFKYYSQFKRRLLEVWKKSHKLNSLFNNTQPK